MSYLSVVMFLVNCFKSFFVQVQLPGMKWVDGHKGVFNCSVHTESSIHTQVYCSCCE